MADKPTKILKALSVEQLNGLDAAFIYLESARSPMHIGGFSIYDPSTAPGGAVRFKDILKFVDERTHLAKPFYQKLQQVPLGVDHPYWVDDPEFDIEYHVRHIALPQPGDWRQLCIQVARIHARPLDLSKPLWEMTVVEGLDNIPGVPKGSYAIITKIHHCAIDGLSGVEMAEALHDLTPNVSKPKQSSRKSKARSLGNMEMLARANINNVTKPFHALNVARRMAPGALKLLAGLRSSDVKFKAPKVPRTRFNSVVSAHRIVEAATFSVNDIKTIKEKVPGATVNDAIVAIVGGAMRHYLLEQKELPKDSMIAMAPVSVRATGEKASMGNQVTAISIPLGTHIADPLARLHYVNQEASNSKEMANAVGARDLSEVSKLSPSLLSGLAARVYMRLGLANRIRPTFNTVVTNVPGPQVPLYMAGAKMVSTYGLGPAVDSVGIFHAVTSYCGDIAITATACRKMIPDPAFYASCLTLAFEELLLAATESKPNGKVVGRKKSKKKTAARAKNKQQGNIHHDSPSVH